jgi:hypothetical protein
VAQGKGNGKVVRLTAERLRRLERRMEAVEHAQRGTNARLDQTNARLDQAIDVLTRLVRVVAVQNNRINRNFQYLTHRVDAFGTRLDRFARSVVAGRTADHRRLAALERRMGTLERRLA